MGDTLYANATNQDFLVWKGRLSACRCLCVCQKLILLLGNNELMTELSTKITGNRASSKTEGISSRTDQKSSWCLVHLKLFLLFSVTSGKPWPFWAVKSVFFHVISNANVQGTYLPSENKGRRERGTRHILLILGVLSPRSDLLQNLHICNNHFTQ